MDEDKPQESAPPSVLMPEWVRDAASDAGELVEAGHAKGSCL